jgi:hypothetical protein
MRFRAAPPGSNPRPQSAHASHNAGQGPDNTTIVPMTPTDPLNHSYAGRTGYLRDSKLKRAGMELIGNTPYGWRCRDRKGVEPDPHKQRVRKTITSLRTEARPLRHIAAYLHTERRSPLCPKWVAVAALLHCTNPEGRVVIEDDMAASAAKSHSSERRQSSMAHHQSRSSSGMLVTRYRHHYHQRCHSHHRARHYCCNWKQNHLLVQETRPSTVQ